MTEDPPAAILLIREVWKNMIDTGDVIAFFDRLAPTWDAGMVRNEAAIETILDLAGIEAGLAVLDVACGTGVLIPDYLARGVAHVTAVDISPEMTKIAQGKFAGNDRVTVLCRDAQTMDLGRTFNRILIYNAFPHFSDPEALFATLCRHLVPGGRLTVAHGMSRERINEHHRGGASQVSNGLPSAETLSALMAPFLRVDRLVSNENLYAVSGLLPGAF